MNLEAPIFQNKDFRTAMQYLINFDRLNKNPGTANISARIPFFEGTIFANPEVKARLVRFRQGSRISGEGGYHRPASLATRAHSPGFTMSPTGFCLRARHRRHPGERPRREEVSFALLYPYKQLEREMTVIQQDCHAASICVCNCWSWCCVPADAGAEIEMGLVNMTSGYYPDPRQYLHTSF